MKKPREWTLGLVENAHGGDIFAITDSNTKVQFGEVIDGIEVVEKSAYNRAIQALKDSMECCDYLHVAENALKELGEIE